MAGSVFSTLSAPAVRYVKARAPTARRLARRVRLVGWSGVVVSAALGALGYYRNEFPDRPQPPYLENVIGWIPWYGWIILALGAILVVGFDAAHREIAALENPVNTGWNAIGVVLDIEPCTWSTSDCQYLGIVCFNHDDYDVVGAALELQSLSQLSRGTWIDLKRMEIVGKSELVVARGDRPTAELWTNIHPGSERRFVVAGIRDADNALSLGSLNPIRFGSPDGTIYRARMLVEAPQRKGHCVEFWFLCRRETHYMTVDGHPKAFSTDSFDVVEQSDDRILGAVELPHPINV